MCLAQTTVKTDIDNVTVYLRGAMVYRSGKVNLVKGDNTLIIPGLSTQLNEPSLRVNIVAENITVLKVNHENNFQNTGTGRNNILRNSRRIDILTDSITYLNSLYSILEEEKNLILSNKNVGGQNGVSAQELSAMAQYYRKQLTEISVKTMQIAKTLENYQKELLSLKQERENLQVNEFVLTSSVKVVLNSKQAYTSVPVEISYLVEDAGWNPFYEVRVKETDQPLNLIYKANVKQNSKEDWNNVKLVLSTGNPSISNVCPPFYTMYLPPRGNRPVENIPSQNNEKIIQGYVVDANNNPLEGASVSFQGSSLRTTTDNSGHFSLVNDVYSDYIDISYIGYSTITIYPDYSKCMIIKMTPEIIPVISDNISKIDQSFEVAYDAEYSKSKEMYRKSEIFQAEPIANYQISMNVEENRSALEFKIDLPYTIPSDNKEYSVSMIDYQMPVIYRYSCTPRYSDQMYLMADVTQWNKLPLLKGSASLFLKNIYQGTTVIVPDFSKDTLQLSIGRDKSIVVNREEIRDLSAGQVIGSGRKVTKSFNINVKNNKSIPVEIQVEDQYPISTADDIKVALLNAEGAEVDKLTGKLTWKIKLQAGAKQTVNFTYEVKYPRKYNFTVE